MDQALAQVLAEIFNLRPEQIVPELHRDDVGGWDSLKQMDMVLSLENHYGITLDIPDILRMDSVANIIASLKGKGVQLED